ncbi:hypothetical protein GCM10027287_43810 [Bordetella muralis]
MRELSCSELPCIAGGIRFDNNVISVIDMVSSLAGYDFSTNVMQTLGLVDGRTQTGASLAAFGGGTIALSRWNDPVYHHRDRVYIGMVVSFLWGVGMGVAEGAHPRHSPEHH